jgi:predicted O-methyltransferase YrrM
MTWINWVKYGISDIKASISYLRGKKEAVNVYCLKKIFKMLQIDTNLVDYYFSEIKENDEFKCNLSSALSGFTHLGHIGFPEGLYILVRILKPNIVVETGVAAGISSSYLLLALEANKRGKLYSIDMPNYELEYFPKLGLKPISILPEGKKPGFVIPQDLKDRWCLRIGKSQNILLSLLSELGFIDMFLHDSEHTYENMRFEYEIAWEHLRNQGLLLSDNINMNSAFKDFAKKANREYVYIYFAGWAAIFK